MFNQPFWLGHREFPPEYVIKKPNQIGNTNKPNCIVTYSFQPHFPTNETNEFLVFLQSFRRTDGSLDSRMNHLGCPVLYGDKWIGNKWVRWQEQVLLIWGFPFNTAADIPSIVETHTFRCPLSSVSFPKESITDQMILFLRRKEDETYIKVEEIPF